MTITIISPYFDSVTKQSLGLIFAPFKTVVPSSPKLHFCPGRSVISGNVERYENKKIYSVSDHMNRMHLFPIVEPIILGFSFHFSFEVSFPTLITFDGRVDVRSSQKRTKEQPVTLRGRGPRSSQSPLKYEPQPLPETQEQPVTLRRRGPRSTQTPSEQETSPAPSSKAEMGRRQCKSTYNNIKHKTSSEPSPSPKPRPEHCNVDKAEENDLKNSHMKMIEVALESKMKNAIKEIEEKTNKKLEENNK
ncbi:hypothetical protein STEG23_002944 [Scotinomys teguina]